MSQTRRDFVKAATIGAVAIAASDRIAELIAQSPQGKVLESKFKGLSDLVLAPGTPSNTARSGGPSIPAMSRSSFEPTTTSFVAGFTCSTNRGRPSAEGTPRLRPLR